MNLERPPSYPPISPVLTVPSALLAIGFYGRAFGAMERFRLTDPESGRIAHVELTLGAGLLLLTEAATDSPSQLTPALGIRLCFFVTDVDAVTQAAVAAGALVQRPPRDEFYGHRCGRIRDPFGYEWMLFQENEFLTPSEMQRRWPVRHR